jgi:hypothetical protein
MTKAEAATTTCAHCGNRFERGRRQNQHRRADGARHQGGRYCTDKCRKRASRARLQRRSASVTTGAKLSVTEPPGTIPHASVTSTTQPIETKAEFSTEKTVLGHQEREFLPAPEPRVLDGLPDAFPNGQGGTVHALHAAPGPMVRRSMAQALPPGFVPDAKWPGMYRLVLADGSLSDMVNLTRAKDALLHMKARAVPR